MGPAVFCRNLCRCRSLHNGEDMNHPTIAVALLLTVTITAHAEERVRHAFESSVPRGSVRRVIVDIPAGEINIRNGPPERLSVRGVVSRDPDGPRSRAKEQRIVDDTTVEIYINDDEAIVRRRFGPEAEGFRGELFSGFDVTLELPRGVDIDLETRMGDVFIEGSFGDIDVDLRAGEIDVRLPRADVRELRASCRLGEVRTNIGDEIIEREGILPGRTRYLNRGGRSFVNVHTTLGEVRVTLTP